MNQPTHTVIIHQRAMADLEQYDRFVWKHGGDQASACGSSRCQASQVLGWHGVDASQYAAFRSQATGRNMAAGFCRCWIGATLAQPGPSFGLTGTDRVSNLVCRAQQLYRQSANWRKTATEIEATLYLKRQTGWSRAEHRTQGLTLAKRFPADQQMNTNCGILTKFPSLGPWQGCSSRGKPTGNPCVIS